MKSTCAIPASIIRLTALMPAPPTPTTRITARYEAASPRRGDGGRSRASARRSSPAARRAPSPRATGSTAASASGSAAAGCGRRAAGAKLGSVPAARISGRHGPHRGSAAPAGRRVGGASRPRSRRRARRSPRSDIAVLGRRCSARRPAARGSRSPAVRRASARPRRGARRLSRLAALSGLGRTEQLRERAFSHARALTRHRASPPWRDLTRQRPIGVCGGAGRVVLEDGAALDRRLCVPDGLPDPGRVHELTEVLLEDLDRLARMQRAAVVHRRDDPLDVTCGLRFSRTIASVFSSCTSPRSERYSHCTGTMTPVPRRTR